MNLVVLALGYGVVSASIIAMGAVGFSLQYGMSQIFNVSYGAMMTVSAYAAYVVDVRLHAGLWLGIAGAGATGCLLAVASERLLFTPFLRRGATAFVIVMVSLALDIFVQNAIVAVSGFGFVSYGLAPGHVYRFLGTDWTSLQFVLVGISIAAMLFVGLTMTKTKLGKAMRATAADPELAGSCGIKVRRSTTLTWALSGILCGLGGVALGISSASFSNLSGDDFLFVVFAAAVIGGLGNAYGAVLGALVIGITTEEVAIVSPGLQDVAAFAILAFMLLARPGGLIRLGGRVRADTVTV